MKIEDTAGDMAIKDLTPKTTNIGNRIVKNMRICGSGIYTYGISEASLLHLTPIPEKYKSLTTINVYRPPEVLEKSKEMFARIPIITGHHVVVNRDNAKELSVGMVGDEVESEVDEEDGETYLYTTGTIVAGDGVEAYEKYGQLSVGYDPIIEWGEGEHKGVPYQAILKGFKDINHLLICKVARGGPQCMVMDSLDDKTQLQRFILQHNGGEDMGIFKKIFGSNQKKLAGDAAVVSTLLQSIAAGANPKIQVQKIRDIVGDSDKVFGEYLGELEMAGDEKPEVVAKAVEIVDNYYRDNMCGDEKSKDEKPKDDEKSTEGDEKSKDEKPKDDEKSTEGDEKPKDDEKSTEGDEKACGDELKIDYDLLAQKITEKMKTSTVGTAGDEFSPEMNGDSASNKKSSDDFMKEIWG